MLRTSQARLSAGQPGAARGLLQAFIGQISANPGGRLTQEQIDSLISIAETAIASIGN